MRVLITGATGFIGTALSASLLSRGHHVTAAVRRPGSAPPGTTEILIDDVGARTRWESALAGQDAVVHLAARVHVMKESAADPLTEFRAVNTQGTLRLAEEAIAAGVASFVHMSSIKANGEGERSPYTVQDEPVPVDPYGISKLEAERGLATLAGGGETHVTSIRIPLVYGPGAGGNFVRLLRIVASGTPVPLASVRNRRTMISIWNVIDLVEHQLQPAPGGYELVMAGDSDSLSTPSLMRAIGRGLGRPPRLIPFPVRLLRVVGRLLRRGDEVQRLTGSLEVQIGSTRPSFSWSPPVLAQQAIERTASEWTRHRLAGSHV